MNTRLLSVLVVTVFSWLNVSAEAILIEAESMAVDGEAWQALDHFRGWYDGVPSGQRMLRGFTGGQGEARKQIALKEPGRYRVWVRYLDVLKYRGPIEVEVRQGDKRAGAKKFNTESLRKSPEGLKKWGRGFAQFVWGSFEVELATGTAEIVVRKADPLRASWIARHVDCFVLTQDMEYVPRIVDFVDPLYLRITMGKDHSEPCAIHLFGRRPRRPWYLKHHNITQKGLFPGAWGGIAGQLAKQPDVLLSAGECSPWVNIAPLLATLGLNRIQLTAIRSYLVLLPEASFSAAISRTASEEGLIRTFRRTGSGAGILVTIDQTDLEHCRQDLDWSREALEHARALPKIAGRRPRRFPSITGCAISPKAEAAAVVNGEIEILSRLGFSGLSALPVYVNAGFVHPRSAGFYFHLRKQKCLYQPELKKIQRYLEDRADKIKANKLPDKVTYFSLMDEPSSMSFEHIVGCTTCRSRFADYVRDQGLKPADLGKQSWGEIVPTDDGEKDPKLFYYTAQFRAQALADFFRLGTRILEKELPGVPTTTNFAESLTFYGNLLKRGADWFKILEEGGVTLGWTEEWLSYAATYQLCGYRADFLRSACGRAGRPFGMYNIIKGRSGWDVQVKGVAALGHGSRAMHCFNYGPYYSPTSDQASHQYERYAALQKLNYAVGGAEDYLVESKVAPARIALHYSHATDIWTLEETYSPFGKERMGLYLILRQLGYATDIITEQDIADGGLEQYRFLIMLGSHMDRRAAGPLQRWVEKGGHLYLGPETGAKDEYNQPLNLARAFGFEPGDWKAEQSCGRAEFEYPKLKLLRRVSFEGGQMEAVCARQPQELADGAEALARFEDNSIAMSRRTVGQGSVILSGFLPGIAYARGGAIARKKKWEATNKEWRKHTYNAPSFPEVYRKFFRAIMQNAGLEPSCATNHYLVEADRLESPRGLVIALSNWSGVPQEGLELRVKTRRTIGKVYAVHSPVKQVRKAGNAVTIQLDLDAADFLVLPFEEEK